jgi:GAF domain-containing protein
LDIDEVYSRIGIEVGKLIHFDRLSISVVNEENDTAAITFIAGLEIPESPVGRLFPLSESSSIHVTKTKTTQLILPRSEHELAESVPVMLILYRAGLKSFIVVPLISKGRVIAVLRLGSFEVNSYDHDEVRVAE